MTSCMKCSSEALINDGLCKDHRYALEAPKLAQAVAEIEQYIKDADKNGNGFLRPLHNALELLMEHKHNIE